MSHVTTRYLPLHLRTAYVISCTGLACSCGIVCCSPKTKKPYSLCKPLRIKGTVNVFRREKRYETYAVLSVFRTIDIISCNTCIPETIVDANRRYS